LIIIIVLMSQRDIFADVGMVETVAVMAVPIVAAVVVCEEMADIEL
jgi:hypothetical protein